jgi:hypothetical protein
VIFKENVQFSFAKVGNNIVDNSVKRKRRVECKVDNCRRQNRLVK